MGQNVNIRGLFPQSIDFVLGIFSGKLIFLLAFLFLLSGINLFAQKVFNDQPKDPEIGIT